MTVGEFWAFLLAFLYGVRYYALACIDGEWFVWYTTCDVFSVILKKGERDGG